MNPRRSVLLLPLEFATWSRARAWSYGAQLAVEEGLRASGARVTVLPAFNELPAGHPGSFLTGIDHWCRGQTFDEIWLWPCLTKYGDAVLAWAAERAPVRVGLITESLSFSADERRARPDFSQYRRAVVAHLPFLTHACAVDEHDVAWLQRRGVPAFWWPGTVPQRALRPRRLGAQPEPAAFVGNPYGVRARWLTDARLRGWLRHRAPAERPSLSSRFDRLHGRAIAALIGGRMKRSDCSAYLDEWRALRARTFDGYLDALASCSAIVGLPGFVKTYAGRVVEGMAVGRPVVSPALERRPRTGALFADGEEILLYDGRDQAALAAHLRWLRQHPEAGRAIAERARRVVSRHHTVEARVRQVHEWMECGRTPDFRREECRRLPKGTARRVFVALRTRALAKAADVRFPLLTGAWATTKVDDLIVSLRCWRELRERLAAVGGTREIVCWGAGLQGRAVHAILTAAGFTVSAFLDADPDRDGTRWEGLPVRRPDSLAREAPARPFVVVTSLYARDIARRLRALGYRRRRDFMVAE